VTRLLQVLVILIAAAVAADWQLAKLLTAQAGWGA